ncbi:MAG: nucleotidyltransferase family protein [Armatimonadota bacterium]
MSGLSDIQGAILAGGKGTRLRPVVPDRPKVLAEINGRPFVFYLLEYLAGYGIRRVILCTGFMSEQVRHTVGREFAGIKVSYSRETEPLDTAGALRLALRRIDSDPVLVLNGDSLFTADLEEFYCRHTTSGATGSLLLVEMTDCRRYGTVRTDDSGRVISFEEKSDRPGSGYVSAGVYILSRQIVESIPPGKPVSIEREVFPAWVGRGLYGFVGNGSFIDIGTPESYTLAGSLLDGRLRKSDQSW